MNIKAKKMSQSYEYMIENYNPRYRERPVEYAFLFRHISMLKSIKSILDTGPGNTHIPADLASCGFEVTAMDTKPANQYFNVIQDDITKPNLSPEVIQFDCVICISVLEHIANWQAAIRNIYDLTRPGGYMILTFPYSESQYHPNIYKDPGAGYGKDAKFICQIFSRNEINQFPGNIVEQEYWQIFEGRLWTFGKRTKPIKADADSLHHLTCLLVQKDDTTAENQ